MGSNMSSGNWIIEKPCILLLVHTPNVEHCMVTWASVTTQWCSVNMEHIIFFFLFKLHWFVPAALLLVSTLFAPTFAVWTDSKICSMWCISLYTITTKPETWWAVALVTLSSHLMLLARVTITKIVLNAACLQWLQELLKCIASGPFRHYWLLINNWRILNAKYNVYHLEKPVTSLHIG